MQPIPPTEAQSCHSISQGHQSARNPNLKSDSLLG
jgi:hypothetical protein